MSIDVRDEAAGFVNKWRARWPEWALAMVFVPAPQRDVVEAWFALLQELTDAAWTGSDPVPGLAKLAWWQDELGGWEKRARRHPLGAVLQPRQAPWRALGLALPALRAMRADGDRDDGLPMAAPPADGQAFAQAVAACEAALFEGRTVDAGAVAAVSETLAGEQALLHSAGGAAVPAAGDAGAFRPGTLPRGIHLALLKARLATPGRAVPPLRTLMAAWRGARRAG